MQTVETAQLPMIEWASYGDVPVCWTKTDAPFSAGIIFRAGIADETLPTRGMTHLVEHLALQRLGDGRSHFNGAVGPTTTTFYASGREDDVLTFLEQAVASVGRLNTAKLGSEVKIVLIENDGRSDDVVGRLLRLAFGYQDYGLTGTNDQGLFTLEAAQLHARAASAFTRRNAVVWIVGEPPPQLDLQIPTGSWMAPPAIGPDRPAHGRRVLFGGSGGVAIGMLMERSHASTLGLTIAAERAHRLLREQRGLSYGVQTDWVPLDATTGHGTIMADCVDEDASQVAQLLIDVLERIAAVGVTWDELERIDEEDLASLHRPERHVAALQGAADDYLAGRTPRSLAERFADRRAVDEQAVAVAMRAGLGRAVMVESSNGRRTHQGWKPWLPSKGSRPIYGRTFKPRGQGRLGGLRPTSNGASIMLAPEGIAYTFEQTAVCYPVEDIAGYLVGTTGMRMIYGKDGARITIDPDEWADGNEMIRLLDRIVPPELVLRAR